jgi:hypothetical protein
MIIRMSVVRISRDFHFGVPRLGTPSGATIAEALLGGSMLNTSQSWLGRIFRSSTPPVMAPGATGRRTVALAAIEHALARLVLVSDHVSIRVGSTSRRHRFPELYASRTLPRSWSTKRRHWQLSPTIRRERPVRCRAAAPIGRAGGGTPTDGSRPRRRFQDRADCWWPGNGGWAGLRGRPELVSTSLIRRQHRRATRRVRSSTWLSHRQDVANGTTGRPAWNKETIGFDLYRMRVGTTSQGKQGRHTWKFESVMSDQRWCWI